MRYTEKLTTGTVREAAVRVLLRVLEEDGTNQSSTREALSAYSFFSARVRAFLLKLTDETLAHLILLDSTLNRFAVLPVDKQKPAVRAILRSAAAQIFYMDAVPHHAAVDEAVKLAGVFSLERLKPFVNGVLRSLLRGGLRMRLPDKQKEPLSYLSEKYSVPVWIIQRFAAAYGLAAAETVLQGMNTKRPLSLRVNTANTTKAAVIQKLQAAGVKAGEHPYLPYALTIDGVQEMEKLPGFAEGDFVVQDTASMLAGEVLHAAAGERCLDMCAAPGGKSLHLANSGARVTACDKTQKKLSLLSENTRRCGFSNISAVCADARISQKAWTAAFDKVLCDAPCSGLGVMGRKYDIRYHAAPENIEKLARLQQALIHTGLSYVKPGGLFLYSTCTIAKEENEENARFICRDGRFSPVDLNERLPEAVLHAAKTMPGASAQLSQGMLQLLPGYMESDGFFLALFRRKAL